MLLLLLHFYSALDPRACARGSNGDALIKINTDFRSVLIFINVQINTDQYCMTRSSVCMLVCVPSHISVS